MNNPRFYLLEQEAPALAARLQLLSPLQRRRALLAASLVISSRLDDLEPRIAHLLDGAFECDASNGEKIAEMIDYSKYADDRYFTLQEEGAAEEVWKGWFAKARLGAAIVNILRDDTFGAAYELCFAGDDKESNIASIQEQIGVVARRADQS